LNTGWIYFSPMSIRNRVAKPERDTLHVEQTGLRKICSLFICLSVWIEPVNSLKHFGRHQHWNCWTRNRSHSAIFSPGSG
jgi:hypothetical protein